LAQSENAAWIATGHTADDQAETVLFRLLRGSGVLGLRGIAECRPLESSRLIRPLLRTRRQQVLDYLRDNQLTFRTDSSNRDLRFTRNRLRLELLPRLEQEYNPAIVDALRRLAEQAAELYADIAARAAQLLREAELPRAGSMLVFAADRLQQADANLVREMFRLVWQREGWPMSDMDYSRWYRLVEIAAGISPRWEFPGKIHARRVGKVVQIQTVN
jgi:tRNA(Ile)-lysidine synthase